MTLNRRRCLAVALLPALPAAATPESLSAAIRAFAGDGPLRSGRITIEIAELVENGNTVPLSLSVQSPMSATDHVQSLAVFTERNPQPEVAVFHFSHRSGRARVDTRIRLATSQPLVAVAKMNDGSVWQQAASRAVTVHPCVDRRVVAGYVFGERQTGWRAKA